jgi:hypothetical protein
MIFIVRSPLPPIYSITGYNLRAVFHTNVYIRSSKSDFFTHYELTVTYARELTVTYARRCMAFSQASVTQS